METLEDILTRLLPTAALPPPQADPIPADQDLLIQRLMGTICPPKPVAQERSVTELETMLLNWLPVGTVTEEKAASPNPSTVSAEGCFSCGVLTHTTADCRTLDAGRFYLRDGRRNASETSSSWDRVPQEVGTVPWNLWSHPSPLPLIRLNSILVTDTKCSRYPGRGKSGTTLDYS